MASEATIKLTLEEGELLNDLSKVGRGFDSVAKKVDRVEKNTDKLAKSTNTAGNVFKGFLTLEMAKKIGAFADQTLRAADSMENLSLDARQASADYIESMNGLKELAQTFVFGFAEALQPALSKLSSAAKEATEYWAQIFGVDKEAESRNRNDQVAKLNEARALVRVNNVELKKIDEKLKGDLSNSDRSFYLQRQTVVRSALDNAKAMEKEYADNVEESTERITEAEEEAQKAREKNAPKNTEKAREKNAPKKTEKAIAQGREIDWSKITSDRLDALDELRSQSDEILEQEKQDERDRLDFKMSMDKQAEQDERDYLVFKMSMDKQAEQSEYEKNIAIDAARAELSATELDNLEYNYARKKEMHKESAEYQHEVDLWYAEEKEKLNKKEEDDELMKRIAIMQGAATMFGGLSQLTAQFNKDSKAWTKMSLSLAEAEAIANTAAGVTMAYRQGGVAGLLTGIGVGAAGAAQVVAIEKQKQKLWDGGIVQGSSMGDTVEVNANGGEMMLTKGDQIGLLGAIRNGSLGGNTINATFAPQYSRDTPTIDKTRDYNEFVRVIKTLQSDPAYTRRAGAFV